MYTDRPSGPTDTQSSDPTQWVSAETELALAVLTPQQARGVLRIVEARVLHKRGVNSLLDGPGAICTHTTYYRKNPPGWSHQPAFQQAVALAERDLLAWFAAHALDEALMELKRASGDAARELRRQVTGDTTALATLVAALESPVPEERRAAAEQLGQSEHAAAAGPLAARFSQETDAGVRAMLIWALGRIAAAGNFGAFRASSAVLDRVGTETAAKGQTNVVMDWRTAVMQAQQEAEADGDAGDADG